MASASETAETLDMSVAAVDAIVALAMVVERAEHKPDPVELLGWL